MNFHVYILRLMFTIVLICLLICNRKTEIFVDGSVVKSSLPSASSSIVFRGLKINSSTLSDEQRLFYTLMKGYEKAVRPTKKALDPVIVKLGITLTQIMDLVRDNYI